MKRSLTIGCVLLVGGGASNCGGNTQSWVPDWLAGGGHGGATQTESSAGSAGVLIGLPAYTSGTGGEIGICVGCPDPATENGAGGDDAGYIGLVQMPPDGAAGDGGQSGSRDEPPGAGSGGFVGIPPR